MDSKEKIKQLKKLLDGNKKLKEEGKKGYVSWSDVQSDFRERIKTGSLLLDHVLGGGLIRGSMSQWYGGEGGGKSLLVSMIAAAHQKAGLPVMYIDAENKFDPEYALKTTGFDVFDENLALFSQEDSADIVYEMCENAAKLGFGLCVVDSTDSLMTHAEESADYGDAHMMQMARFNSMAIKKLKGSLNNNKCSLIFISQVRTQMIQGGGSYDDTNGGKALKFYSSLRNNVKRVKIVEDKESGDAKGIVIAIRNKKNQMGIPFRECELTVFFNEGLDSLTEVVELAIKYGVVTGKGWYSHKLFPDGKIQGKDKIITFCRENKSTYEKLRIETETAMQEASNKSKEINAEVVDEEEVIETQLEPSVENEETAPEEVNDSRAVEIDDLSLYNLGTEDVTEDVKEVEAAPKRRARK